MNEQLSILELVSNATIVVQLVMALLVLASVVSWILVFQKAFLRKNQIKQWQKRNAVKNSTKHVAREEG